MNRRCRVQTTMQTTMMNSRSIFFFALFALSSAKSDIWYNEQFGTQPVSKDASCPMKRQSPINIETNNVVGVKYVNDLKWSGSYEAQPQSMRVLNTGSTVKFMLNYENDANPILHGGPLLNEYKLVQLHFHWGSTKTEGSEHTIDGKSFPMEVHAVHTRTNMNDRDINNKFDGYTVVGYMFELGEKNEAVQKLVDQFPEIKNQSTVDTAETFKLFEFMPKFTKNYYYYEGSLTTPPFTEAVQWIISNEKIVISEEQFKEFQNLASNNVNMQDNYRQPLANNGRSVKHAV